MKKLLALILCLILTLFAVACDDYYDYYDDYDDDDYYYDDDYDYYDDYDDDDYYYDDDDYDYYDDDDDDDDDYYEQSSGDAAPSFSSELDMSSSGAFIYDVQTHYLIVIEDEYGFLSANDGRRMMVELETALRLYSRAFITTLVGIYEEYGSDFIVRLEDSDEEASGIAEWDDDLIIILYYEDSDENGITAHVFAHELAHAVQFIIAEEIGDEQLEADMISFNGGFPYVGEYNYEYRWDEDVHSSVFAYDYGMSDFWEDWTTIIEEMVKNPSEMTARLSEYQNEPLFLKTSYIRDMTYKYISSDCKLLFEPLLSAEAHWGQAAA